MWIGIADFFFFYHTLLMLLPNTKARAHTHTHIYIYIYKYIHKHIQAHARVIDPLIQCSIAGTVIPPVCYICSPLFRVSLVFLQFFLLFFFFFFFPPLPLRQTDVHACKPAHPPNLSTCFFSFLFSFLFTAVVVSFFFFFWLFRFFPFFIIFVIIYSCPSVLFPFRFLPSPCTRNLLCPRIWW
ncbi:hypothetical protein Tb11.02.4690 [Trypanosoma brucei brucei TREU927]|uniref:T. brucei spp.-specific protein n=1 Tax=Trypanosoma brucei brucei (strain 927/4 GUTat10.1) TaxID=185431 RepID=Q384Y4_TRYB2|nr:hypothetical protein Tb11.02.4690 [Trypanosoma brucei brucei TREU927]EAN79647.1 hypothetical protein Tb11.02.4690 [Trypanosoma brucei brucei TREU927]